MNKICETAYLVAMYRAIESERPDALFLDPFARLLASGQGQVLVAMLGDKKQAANLIATRTHFFDRTIEQLARSQQIDTVVNLGAGLDTRRYRLCAKPLAEDLRHQHYIVDLASDGIEGWEYAIAADYDLILLDLMLPKLDGISLCKRLMAIKTNAAVALKYPAGMRQTDKEKFEAIASASEQMTRLTEDLLFLARNDKLDRVNRNGDL